MFIIYINDIGEHLLSLSRLFADDTSLGYSSDNKIELMNVIDLDLNELNNWSSWWLMSFNPDKTEIMLFSNREVEGDINFSFDGKPVPLVKSHKHLGLTMNSDGKWTDHINNITNSATKHLNILRKLKYVLNEKI